MGLPLISPKVQFFDLNGDPLNGGKVLTKVAGGGADKTTYSDAALTTPNANPIILNSRGEASVFAAAGEVFWLRLTDSADVTIWTVDNVTIPLDAIANGAVTEAKIATGAVTTTKLGDLAVTMAKISTTLVHDHTDVTMVTADDRVFITDASDSNKNKKALIPAATEALKGIAQIATTAQVTTGSDDTTIVTPLKLTEAVQSRISDTMVNTTTTGGTSLEFTGIPSWAKRITMLLSAVSTSGSSALTVQIGDAGGFESSGYTGCVGGHDATTLTVTNHGSFFQVDTSGAAGASRSGTIILHNISGNVWGCFGVLGRSDTTRIEVFGGSKTLTDVLTQVRLIAGNGTDTFDTVNVTVFWEG